MKDKKILVVDDDPAIVQLLAATFRQEGATVYTAAKAQEALQEFYARRPDLVVLDVMMPDMDGWEVCRIIRQLSDVPVIILTTLSSDTDVIRGLYNGADDYITKPFNAQVVLARAKVALRRSALSPALRQTASYSDGYLTIDLAKKLVLIQSQPVKLTALQYRLLAYFLQNANQVLTPEQILQNVWGWEYQDEPGHVRIFVWQLRQKLEQDPKQPNYLLTEYGLGYRFKTQTNS